MKSGRLAQRFTRTNFSLDKKDPEKFERLRAFMYYIYVLRSSKDKKLYSGYSSDLRKRVIEHNKGKVDVTKHRRPFSLIYYEAYQNQQDATAREKYFKTQWGRNYLKKVLKNYWSSLDS